MGYSSEDAHQPNRGWLPANCTEQVPDFATKARVVKDHYSCPPISLEVIYLPVASELVKKVLDKKKIRNATGCPKIVAKILKAGSCIAIKMFPELIDSVIRESRVPDDHLERLIIIFVKVKIHSLLQKLYRVDIFKPWRETF